MATRMQQRRGTASQWTTANPILATGEIGFETDTNQFKIGDGTNNWESLSYFKNLEDLGGSLDDYLLVENVGQAGFAASLDVNGYIPVEQLGNIMGEAPEILDTLEELAGALTDVDGLLEERLEVLDAGVTTRINEDLAQERDLRDAAIAAAMEFEGTQRNEAIEEAASTLSGEINTLSADIDTLSGELDAESSARVTAISNLSDDIQQQINSTQTTLSNSITSTVNGAKLELSNDITSAVNTAIDELETYADGVSATAQASAETTAQGYVSTHNSDTTNVHGISDTAELETQTGAQAKADTAQQAAEDYSDGLASNYDAAGSASTAVSTHNSGTTNVHGIADTADLLLKSGGTMTGSLTLSGAPTSSLHAATKSYVDNTASGIVAKPQVLGATTANIDATYDNGTAGVGATLTHNSNGEFPSSAGGAEGWAIGKGILVKSQTNKAQNGRYYVSDMGSVSTPYVLTRCGYCDEASEIPGAYIFVQDGTNAGTGWVQTVADATTFTVGTDDINVVQFSGAGTITAGTNISVSGNEVSLVATPEVSGIEFTDGTQVKQGVPSLTNIVQHSSGLEYTPGLTDRDKLIEIAYNQGSVGFRIPLNSSVAFPVGTSFDILQTGVGQVEILTEDGVTVNATPGLKLRTQWSSATLFKRATDTWVVFGDLSA